MKKNSILFFFLFFFCIFMQSFRALGQAASEYQTIMQHVQEVQWSKITDISSLNNTVESTLSSLQSNGSWTDINYSDRTFTVWKPIEHLVRVKNFALAYTMPTSNYYGSSVLYQAIVNSLTYWDQTDPQSDNWWFNQIASPQKLGEVLVLLRAYTNQSIPASLEDSLIVQMNRGNPSVQAGANKLDIAIHFIYRGCLKADASITQTGVSEALAPIELTTAEGLQHDYSYQQHGDQLYIGGYGIAFVDGEVNVAMYLKGTSYALSGAKLNLLSSFVRNTYMKTLRGKYIDYNVGGRSISRTNSLNSGGLSESLEKLKTLDTVNVAAYDEAIARLKETQSPSYMVEAKHTNYWRSDYTQHNRSTYNFNLRNVSTRTLRSENGNGENLKGYFLADGATNITVNGNEYYNIFPVWDWNKIPGVTAPQYASLPVRPAWSPGYGTESFVGGVSDGIYGASVYSFNDYSVNARKSWFFFDDEVVCLGGAINATGAETINTTVNQCLLNGDVTVSSNGSTSVLSQGAYSYDNNLQWALHGNVGYFFPQGGNLQLTNQAQTGNWYNINTSQSNQSVTSDVFKLWFNHGVTPANASYAYIVVPNKTTVQDMQNYDASKIQIMANTSSIQAVKHTGLNIWQLVFYTATTFTYDNVTVQVDKPCVLMLKNVGSSNVTVDIADPAQSNAMINVNLNLPSIDSTRHLECTMPSASYAGSSVSYTVNSNTPVYNPTAPIKVLVAADTYVRDGGSASTNFGTANGMVIKKDGVGYTREVYLKFDLNALPVATIDKASLKLNVAFGGASVASTTWQVYYVPTDSWTETGINWNNKPAPSTLLSTVNGKNLGIAEWNITPQVLSELGSDKILSLKIVSTVLNTGADATFSSREDANGNLRPQIEISFLNTAPTVAITSPTNNAILTAGSNVTINADAADTDGTISKVEFYQGSTLLGQSTTAPYSFAWNNAPVGTYAITAKVTDNNGAVTTSSVVNIVVNAAPTVSITSPVNNASYDPKTNVVIDANASDSDGSISKVEFFMGSTKLGEDLTAPYSFTWNGVSAGTYTLTAMATDNSNAVTTSAYVTITVNGSATLLTGADSYVRDGSYSNTNYGTASQLVVKKDGTAGSGYNRIAYLKFDLSAYSGSLDTVKLKLAIQGGGTTVANTQWELWYCTTDSWTETNINWNNKPATTTLLGTQPGKNSGVAEWDITNQVNAEISGDKILTLAVVSTVVGSTTDVTFNSREVTNAALQPQLELISLSQPQSQRMTSPKVSLSSKEVYAINAPEVNLPSKERYVLYPNPVQDNFNVSISSILNPNATIAIYNMLGNKIRQVLFTTVPQNIFAGDLPAGNYIVVVQNGVETFRSIIVKQ